jgi:hypothetical protein
MVLSTSHGHFEAPEVRMVSSEISLRCSWSLLTRLQDELTLLECSSASGTLLGGWDYPPGAEPIEGA